MPWPYDDPAMLPDFLMTQGALPAPAFQQAAPPDDPSEAELMSLLQNPPQEAMPNDFFARLAMSTGGQGVAVPEFGPRPTGLEAILSLLAGFANAKTKQAAGRISETDQRNARAREAAKTLAAWRHGERKARAEAADRKAALDQNQAFQRDQLKIRMAEAALARGDMAEHRRIMQLLQSERNDIARDRVSVQADIGGVGGKAGDGAGGGPPPKPRAPAATEVEHMTIDASMLGQINRAKKLYSPQFVGPVDAIKTAAAVRFGGAKKNAASFRGVLAGIRNIILKARSGGAVTEGEAARLLDELPSDAAPEQSFTEKMDQFEITYREIAEKRRKNMEATGVNLSRMEPLPSLVDWPGAQSAPTPTAAPSGGPEDKVTVIRNGVRGTVSRKFLRPTDQVVQ